MAMPQWKGLFEWSMKHNDGTRASSFRREDLDLAKMKWLENVMNSLIQDPTARMREILDALNTGRAPIPNAADGGIAEPASASPADAAAAPAAGGDVATESTSGNDVTIRNDTRNAGDDGIRDVTSRGQPQPDQERQPGELTLAEKEGLLEEVMDLVTSIDLARDFFKLGGLPTLLALIQSPHPSLRWRAAEVVATCAQNNPPVQQWFLDGGVLPRLLDLLKTDTVGAAVAAGDNHSAPSTAPPAVPSSAAVAEVATCRVKALLALSGLVRQFPAGLEALRLAGGLLVLIKASGSPDVKVCRKALGLLHYLLTVYAADSPAACELGVMVPVAAALSRGTNVSNSSSSSSSSSSSGADAGSAAGAAYNVDDAGVRETALSVAIELLQHEGSWAVVHEALSAGPAADTLERIKQLHAAMSPEDKEASADELTLLARVEELLKQRAAASGAAQGADASGAPAGVAAPPGRQLGLIVR